VVVWADDGGPGKLHRQPSLPVDLASRTAALSTFPIRNFMRWCVAFPTTHFPSPICSWPPGLLFSKIGEALGTLHTPTVLSSSFLVHVRNDELGTFSGKGERRGSADT